MASKSDLRKANNGSPSRKLTDLMEKMTELPHAVFFLLLLTLQVPKWKGETMQKDRTSHFLKFS